MKVLLGLDDSPCSHAALEFVKRMPWSRQERWELLSAVQMPVAAYAMPDGGYAGQAIEAAQEQARQQEEWLAGVERELLAAGFSSQAVLVESDARTALVNAAREHRADLLVVGSHGRSGLTKLLLGSVASHVVVHAPCSVLVVKQSKRELDFDRRPMNIVVGIDESPCSRAAVEAVQRMPWPERTRVHLVSTLRPGAKRDVTEGLHAGFDDSLMAEARIRQELVSRYERSLREAGFLVAALTPEGDPREELVKAAADAEADLLVVGSHGRTGLSKLMLGSVASHVVTQAPCSVLVVKETNRIAVAAGR